MSAAAVPVADQAACNIGRWYEQLHACSIRSVILPLPADFVRDLAAADPFFLAGGGDSDDGQAEQKAGVPSFAELRAAIDGAIGQLGGAVFPKLNRSAPTDSAYAHGGSLKCTSADDVLLLLRRSDRVAEEIRGDSFAGEWVLALREWREVRPAGEFR